MHTPFEHTMLVDVGVLSTPVYSLFFFFRLCCLSVHFPRPEVQVPVKDDNNLAINST